MHYMSAFYFSRELMLLVCFKSQTLDGHGVNLYYFIMMTMTVTGMTMMIMVIKKEKNRCKKVITNAHTVTLDPTWFCPALFWVYMV